MTFKSLTALRITVGSLLGGLSLHTLAAPAPPTISFGPASNAVPTLSSGLLIALAIVLAVVAVRLMKNQQMNKIASFAILGLVGASALVAAIMGSNSAKALNAGSAPVVVELNVAEGGQVQLVPSSYPTIWQIVNTTSISLEITAINPGDCSETPLANGGVVSLPPGAVDKGSCAVSTKLEPVDYCTIQLYCPVV
jgi:hypothetical protein